MADRRQALRVGVAVLAVAAVGAGTAAVVAHNGDPAPATTSAGVTTGTAAVVRTNLSTTFQANGTLGYAGSYVIANEAVGTYTALPAPGAVIGRGQRMYEVDGRPVVLCYGARPEWRDLALGVPDGPDVAQLKQNLVALGFGTHLTVNDHFDTATYWAVRHWQAHLGVPVTGSIGRADVVYAPGAIRVDTLHAALGDSAQPGTLADATGTAPVVNLSIPIAELYLAKVGAAVTVTLPDGTTTVPGTIVSVSSVATTDDEPRNGGPQPTGNGQAPTVARATVRLANPAAVRRFNQAPVVVNITEQSVRGVLAVPINALVALAEGGYGLWLVDHGNRRLVAVHTGLFSDTLVQVSGSGIDAGMTVEVPAS
ncbi:MAG TPA: peptidoglycan-binding protein [Pseudonocardiaceae bacterium]|jgi:peptidoglycan hydrolase-like protein with peptidoglycan-binding domain|nr:peptidoglycan-binding protein [Pseudonocardiaceae bacterium]